MTVACQPGWLGSASTAVNAPPVVAIATPSIGAAYQEGDTVIVEVAAMDTDGTIVSVELLVAGTPVAVASAAPFPLTWSASPAGEYQLSARAIDSSGATTESAPVLVTVAPPGGNFAPLVAITSPADGVTVSGERALTITADASDPDGGVARVVFYADGLPIGESSVAPFSVAWGLPSPGVRVLTATAHDDAGATGDSAAVGVTVSPIADPVSGTVAVSLSFPSVERSRSVYLWLETADGTYVDTIEQYFGRGSAEGYPDGSYAVTGVRFVTDKPDRWRSAAGESFTGPLVIDGETRASAVAGGSGSYTSATWDCLSARGNPIPPGAYTVRLELDFDAANHLELPVHYYHGTITLGPGDAVTNLGSLDAKLSSASVTFTPQ